MAAPFGKAAARGSQRWAQGMRNKTRLYLRQQSSFSHLESEMTARKIRPIFDDLTPQYSYRLDTALADFLPETNFKYGTNIEELLLTFHSLRAPRIFPSSKTPLPLPIPHHLLYFEPTKPPSDLLADGTNPDQSPGDPFSRRMWAGGSVLYNTANPLYMDNSRGVCVEGIRDVAIKGKPGDEKVFVGIERRLAGLTKEENDALASCGQDEAKVSDLEEAVRKRLWMASDTDFGPASVIERRNIVFMRERSGAEAKAAIEASRKPAKMLKPQHQPDFTHTLIPDAQLLFRFSALTFNAHSIHLDTGFCQNQEGHRHLLVHGPMSFTLLVTLLQKQLAKAGGERVKFVEYRNLAPLYCYEPLKLCGRKTDEQGKYEVWAETPEGGIAVKGTVKTEKL
ncbi:hypothetical protein MBLNU459_g5331t1 [Dothideomycetes sp. NU459]